MCICFIMFRCSVAVVRSFHWLLYPPLSVCHCVDSGAGEDKMSQIKRFRCFVVGCNNKHRSRHLLPTSEPLKTQRINVTFALKWMRRSPICPNSDSDSDVTCGQVWWPILGICALHSTHPSAHTQQWTHTHHEHTPGAVGSHLCCGARGAVGGSVPCSRAPQSWYWRWRVHSLPPPTIPAGPRLELATFRLQVWLSNH